MKLFKTILSLLLTHSIAFGQISQVDVAGVSAPFQVLQNPGFESGRANWTASGGTFLAVTSGTNLLRGRGSVTWDSSSASQTLVSSSIAIPRGLLGRNGEASCLIQVPSGTGTHTLQAFDGTNVLGSATIRSSATALRTTVNFIFPSSGNIQLRVVSVAADEPLIAIDDCYLGEARNIGLVNSATYVGGMEQAGSSAGCFHFENTSSGVNNWITLAGATSCNAWTTDTGVITAVGTNDHRAQYNNMGAGYYMFVVNGFIHQNAASTCNFRLTDGTNNYQAQAMNAGGGSAGMSTFVWHVPITTTANRTYSIQAADNISSSCGILNDAAGFNFSWKVYRFPLVSETAIRMDQSNYDWTPYTPTFTGFGTVTGVDCRHARDNTDLLLQCNFTMGTGTATEARVSLPGSLVADSTRVISPRQTAGSYTINGVTAASLPVLAEPGVGYITFGVQNASSAGWNKINGSVHSASTLFSVQARVPIQGWTTNQNAPLLVGGVTSSSSGMIRIESVSFGGASEPSTCTSTPCTIYRQSGAVTSVTRTSAGIYTINFSAGVFSAAPVCVVMQGAFSLSQFAQRTATNPTATTYNFQTLVNSVQGDAWGDIICMGPRL